MAIRMRVNNNKDSHCFNCNTTWINTPVMYDLSIGFEHKQKILPVCKKCIDELFTKTLKASTMWDAKVKTKEDQERIHGDLRYREYIIIRYMVSCLFAQVFLPVVTGRWK